MWLALVAVGAALTGAASPALGQAGRPPNVLLIITDDQRAGGNGTLGPSRGKESTLAVMPRTVEWFGNQGTRFTNAFATTPVCCPSRASLMSGQYAHNHGVLTNEDGFQLDQSETIQAYLQAAGYRTGIFGKFLNRWDMSIAPPYWDRWAVCRCDYYDVPFNVDGTLTTVAEYSTTFIAGQAAGFLQSTETDDNRPWFAYVAPFAPHDPVIPEPAYADAPVPVWDKNPAVGEADRSDKPGYVRKHNVSQSATKTKRQQQLRTLMSVDALVDRVMRQLQDQGELEDTLAIFMSDNGFVWAEHGLSGKYHSYIPSVEVHTFLRWPGHVAAGIWDRRITGNVDIAPTVLEATGVDAPPDAPVDGHSLLGSATRSRILLEQWYCGCAGTNPPPTWASTWTTTFQYTEYHRQDGGVSFREYYDLRNDPWQLVNLLHDGNNNNNPNYGPLSDQLRRDRNCEGTSCP